MNPLGVGIIGLGVGEQHIKGFRAHPNARVVALCDIDAAVRIRMKERYADLDIVADSETLIGDPRIDVVSIATYDDAHYNQVASALKRGKHVFVEKPLCLTVDEFRGIRSLLATRPDIVLSSNLILRRCPRFIELRSLIAQGTLGRLFHIEGDYLYGRLHKLTQGWRGDVANYSVTLGGAIHLIDLLLWLTNDRVRDVVAVGNGIASIGSRFGGVDMVTALLRFESGLTGKVSANFGSVYPHFHRLTVYGTEATFENGQSHGLLWRSRDSAAPEHMVSAYPGAAKGDLIPSFVDAILRRGNALVEVSDVLATMAVGLAVDLSLAEGRMVKVAEI